MRARSVNVLRSLSRVRSSDDVVLSTLVLATVSHSHETVSQTHREDTWIVDPVSVGPTISPLLNVGDLWSNQSFNAILSVKIKRKIDVLRETQAP